MIVPYEPNLIFLHSFIDFAVISIVAFVRSSDENIMSESLPLENEESTYPEFNLVNMGNIAGSVVVIGGYSGSVQDPVTDKVILARDTGLVTTFNAGFANILSNSLDPVLSGILGDVLTGVLTGVLVGTDSGVDALGDEVDVGVYVSVGTGLGSGVILGIVFTVSEVGVLLVVLSWFTDGSLPIKYLIRKI